MLIDEVDKIGCGINEDPGSLIFYIFSILALRDPFFFESMDIPVDLTRMLFICTGMSSIVEGDSLDLFKETR